MACGDNINQWIASLLGSVFSGSDSSGRNIVAVFTRTPAVVATVVDGIPLVGTWQFTSDYHLQWTAAVGGISYLFNAAATTCDTTKVTAAGGDVQDSFHIDYSLSLTRVL